MNKNDAVKIPLPDSEIPKYWYNIQADLKDGLAPYYSPRTGQPITPDELGVIFAKELIAQEVTQERYVEIPKEVREMYRQFRPTPVYRARGLEQLLDTKARIYYKYEGDNATGSHKLNSAIAQAYYNKMEGITKLTTETGAGQWGSALSMACSHFGMELLVYMVKVSYNQKPHRRTFMEIFGANVIASPSNTTESGRAILAKDPDCSGSLGMAISEACEIAAKNADTHYTLGSVLNHVCMHQTVIGQEAKRQLEMVDEYPDIVIGCCGGGSNLAGIANPFLMDKIQHSSNLRVIAVEPEGCPTLTKGVYAYDYGDTAQAAPIAKMYTLGHDFVPAPGHAGGLRYHGLSPIMSRIYNLGLMEARAYGQKSVFDAAVKFARAEGIVPAPESSHAIKAAIDEALKAKEEGTEPVILFNLSGHGYFDMTAYQSYFSGQMGDRDYSADQSEESLSHLPDVQTQ